MAKTAPNVVPRARVRAPLARKIVLLILLFVLPLVGVTIYFLLKGPNKDIEFAASELKGDVYFRPLEKLLDAAPRHQMAASDPKLAAEAESTINAAFTALNEAQAKVGEDLGFNIDTLAKSKRTGADPASLKSLWESVAKAGNKTADADAKYAQFISNVSDAIVHAGDKSNLILDPDLDSYYAMDATLNALPQISRRLAALAVLLKNGEGPETDKKAVIFAAQLSDDIAAIRSKFDSIYNEDANFYGRSESLRANTEVALADAGKLVDNLIAVLNKGDLKTETVLPMVLETRSALSSLWGKAVTELDVLLQKRIDSLAGTRLTGLLITGGLLLVASVLAFFIMRTITRPVAALSDAVGRIAAGDETARAEVRSRDEIAQLATTFNSMVTERAAVRQKLEEENKRLQANIQSLLMVVADASDGDMTVRAPVTEGSLGNVADALNLMFENVGDLIRNAKDVSGQVNTTANHINSAAVDLAEGATLQADQLQEASVGVRVLATEAQQVTEACREASSAAAQAEQAADRGAKIVREVIVGMDRIRESVQVNGKKIKRLGERSMEIGGILKTINEISAQTDMLALNASIEAGRAGEAGRGFSAVAEQVRALAERAKLATQQVEKLVGDIQTETSEAVAQTETQTQQVESGAQKVALAGDALNDIVQVSSQSRSAVAKISSTAELQAAKTGEMLRAVSSAASIATESGGKVGGARTASEHLTQLSQDLDRQLAQFTVSA